MTLPKYQYKVVLTDTLFPPQDIERRELSKVGAELIVTSCKTEDDVIKVAKDADGILNIAAPIKRKVIESLQKCKVIARYGIGVDTIDVEAATERGIVVVNVPTFCIEEVATLTIALLLACSRKLIQLDRLVKSGGWARKIEAGGGVHSLQGRTLGLVAFGKIPRSVAQKAKAFGLKILTCDPYIEATLAREHGVELVSLPELLKESDYVSVHTPLTNETRHLFGEKEFKLMKKTAFFINTSRGPVVDEQALYRALVEGWIAGAGLDVMEKEPPDADNPLLKLDNVIITPHIASYTEEAFLRLKTTVSQEVARVLSGKGPLSLVNPAVKKKVRLTD